MSSYWFPVPELGPSLFETALMDWMFGHPPKVTCWNPNPKCDGIRKWAFGKWFGHECVALRNGMRVLITKRSGRAPSPLSTTWGYTETSSAGRDVIGCLEPGRELSAELDNDGALISDSQPLELWEISSCCVSHLVHGNLLQQLNRLKHGQYRSPDLLFFETWLVQIFLNSYGKPR